MYTADFTSSIEHTSSQWISHEDFVCDECDGSGTSGEHAYEESLSCTNHETLNYNETGLRPTDTCFITKKVFYMDKGTDRMFINIITRKTSKLLNVPISKDAQGIVRKSRNRYPPPSLILNA